MTHPWPFMSTRYPAKRGPNVPTVSAISCINCGKPQWLHFMNRWCDRVRDDQYQENMGQDPVQEPP